MGVSDDAGAIRERIEALQSLAALVAHEAWSAECAERFVDALSSGLTEMQHAAIQALDWLRIGGRATGRTHLLAYHAIRCAVLRPGQEVPLFDHAGGDFYSTRMVRNRVIELLDINPRVAREFEVLESSLVYRPGEDDDY